MKRIALFSLCVVLSSCCGDPKHGVLPARHPYAMPSATMQTIMADDAYSELVGMYPAGATTWAVRQATPDTFGQRLVSRFRSAGYAVSEYSKGATAPAGAIPLSYVVDNIAPTYWRVKMDIGSVFMTRGYVEPQSSSGVSSTVGAWVKEAH